MILSCPACRTRYVVPDSAVGPSGRQVRCAACRQSWFQEGPRSIDISAAPPAPTLQREATPPPVPAPMASQEERLPRHEPVEPSDYAAFDHAPPFRARRNPARLWTAIAIATALLIVVAGGALAYFGPSRVAAWFGLPVGSAEVPLLLQVPRTPEPRTLPNGNELLPISGRVVNPTDNTQPIPDILAQVSDASGRVVYSWTIPRPAATVAPRASVNFESAAINAPKGATALNLSFAGDARR